jgi:hypothetical protein
MAATLLSDLQVKVTALATDHSDHEKPSKVASMDTRPSEQFDLETGVNAVATNPFQSKTEGSVTVTNPVAAKTKVVSEDTPSYQEVAWPKTFLDDGRPQLDDLGERSDHEVKWEDLRAAKSRYLQQQERRQQDSPSCTTMGFSREPALVTTESPALWPAFVITATTSRRVTKRSVLRHSHSIRAHHDVSMAAVQSDVRRFIDVRQESRNKGESGVLRIINKGPSDVTGLKNGKRNDVKRRDDAQYDVSTIKQDSEPNRLHHGNKLSFVNHDINRLLRHGEKPIEATKRTRLIKPGELGKPVDSHPKERNELGQLSKNRRNAVKGHREERNALETNLGRINLGRRDSTEAPVRGRHSLGEQGRLRNTFGDAFSKVKGHDEHNRERNMLKAQSPRRELSPGSSSGSEGHPEQMFKNHLQDEIKSRPQGHLSGDLDLALQKQLTRDLEPTFQKQMHGDLEQILDNKLEDDLDLTWKNPRGSETEPADVRKDDEDETATGTGALYFDGSRVLKLKPAAIATPGLSLPSNHFTLDVWLKAEGGQHNPAVAVGKVE